MGINAPGIADLIIAEFLIMFWAFVKIHLIFQIHMRDLDPNLNVLEQFNIIKMPLGLVFMNTYFYKIFQNSMDHRSFFKTKKKFIFFRRFFNVIQSLIVPNFFITKNYVYGRIVIFLFKNYFRLLAKKNY